MDPRELAIIMRHTEKVTVILHTRNRPTFLFRAIEYCDTVLGAGGIRVIVTDASCENHWVSIDGWMKERKLSLPLTMLHSSSTTLLNTRLAEAMSLVTTPYVMLAADDDLYIFDWLEAGVNLLDTDPSFGVVYGHTLQFEVKGFQPFGEVVKCYVQEKKNPPPRWLEGTTVADRLGELGRPDTDLATVGWYSLQRTELLRVIVDYAVENHFDGYLLEKFLIFCQAALSRTRMLDAVFLARQVNDKEQRPPFSFEKEGLGLERLMRVSARVLVDKMGTSEEDAIQLVNEFFRGDIAQLKRADSKKMLRKFANALPPIRMVWNAVARGVGLHKRYPPDPRFPTAPPIEAGHPAAAVVVNAVSRGRAGT